MFGPVLTVLEYDQPAEAFALANDTEYGLQAGVFTRDLDLALSAIRQLDFGGVLVNDVPTTRLDQQPYGGVGESGNTREGPSFTAHEKWKAKLALCADSAIATSSGVAMPIGKMKSSNLRSRAARIAAGSPAGAMHQIIVSMRSTASGR